MKPRLVPELGVSDLAASLRFWRGIAGFEIAYDRPEDGFACLERSGARVILEQRDRAKRLFEAGAMERPFGRGANFEIDVDDVDALHGRCVAAGHVLFLPLEQKTYRVGGGQVTVRQFIVQDPDGYLLRFSEKIAPAR